MTCGCARRHSRGPWPRPRAGTARIVQLVVQGSRSKGLTCLPRGGGSQRRGRCRESIRVCIYAAPAGYEPTACSMARQSGPGALWWPRSLRQCEMSQSSPREGSLRRSQKISESQILHFCMQRAAALLMGCRMQPHQHCLRHVLENPVSPHLSQWQCILYCVR